MKTSAKTLLAAAIGAGALVTTSSGYAAGLNDPNCAPTAARPYPAIVVHGQAGNFEGMRAITDTLVQDGYCVYAKNYGYVPGGANGQDHLFTSAGQIGELIDDVLGRTGASKVDVVGHSAGTGVLNNYILKRGGAAKVHRLVSFGGLHHPYAHAGAPKFLDASVFLPNLTATARKFIPGISIQQVVTLALDTYAAAGAPLGPVDPALAATAKSNFTADLFEPDYWNDLHGSLSEADGTYITVGNGGHSRPTNDAAPNVCYTNIVAVADLVTGGSAGFQDEASNVENYLLTTTVTANAHVDMISDPVALAKMVSGLNAPCGGGAVVKKASFTEAVNDAKGAEAFESALSSEEQSSSGGCSVSHVGSAATGAAWLSMIGGLALVVRRRRRA
ncbi:hypothetical protein LVJ94_06630 [Pendulispora rubella]|uniref:Uncharacterized protein n=1 Tax=Pendulispora rubella TaxID=2741070 RepID=A0ABZ2L9A8_9BACT